jgi:transposase InsO family protein
VIKELIKSIYHKHKGRYGYRRITDELNNQINHKTITINEIIRTKSLIRLKINHIKAKRVKLRQYSKKEISKQFTKSKWATDITEFNVSGKIVFITYY